MNLSKICCMLQLPRDVIQMIGGWLPPKDAHFFAKSCTWVRRSFTTDQLSAFQLEIAREGLLRRRHMDWSEYKWKRRKECPYCHCILFKQRRYDQHVALCGDAPVCVGCPWCRMRVEFSLGRVKREHLCPLQPNVVCGEGSYIPGFHPCQYTGYRLQVQVHRRRHCLLQCRQCLEWRTQKHALDHTNIRIDPCNGSMYRCAWCAEKYLGCDRGKHEKCKDNPTYHQMEKYLKKVT